MIGYVNVHAILEGRRSRARASSSDDPGSTQVLIFLSNQIVLSQLVVDLMG